MEYQKITNLLGNIPDKMSRFITKKWIEVPDQSGTAKNRYKPSKKIKFKHELEDLIFVITVIHILLLKDTLLFLRENNDAYDKKLAFKNNAPFISCISKINTLIDNAEDIGIVMSMYSLIEYSKNYRKKTGSLWDYYRDEPNSGLGGDDNNINYSIKDSKYLDYRASITGKLEDENRTKENVETVVPLKYLSNFWRTLDMPLINCEVSLILTWSENLVCSKQLEMLLLEWMQLIIQQVQHLK